TLRQTPSGVDVIITVTPGARFAMNGFALRLNRDTATAPGLSLGTHNDPLIALVGRPARAADVIAAEDAAISTLRDLGYPFARRGDRWTDLDHANHTVTVTLPVDTGPYVVFGENRITGLDKLSETY